MATVAKEIFHGGTGKSEQALQKRNEQRKKWDMSETSRQPATIAQSRQKPRVKFSENIVFLAAAASGDLEDVETLVKAKGADVNCHSKDGLTALHQACIDDNFDMVKLVISLGANVDAVDNEGWTALHAATSCCHEHIVEYLLKQGAFPAPVNNDGKSPLELLDEVEEGEDGEDGNTRQNICKMLKDAINRQGVDVSAVKSEEERIMLDDANKLKNNPNLAIPLSSSRSTPLHVAAAKNYQEVLKALLSIKSSKINVDALDEDGWTPLHAAVYWGNVDAAIMLVQAGASLNIATKLGETLSDLCDSQEVLESLHKLHVGRDKPRSRPPLPRYNSRERIGDKPSPVVRRRSSKERTPKNKDINEERELREQYSSEEGDELSDTKLDSDTEPAEAGPFNHVPESPRSDSPVSDGKSVDDVTTPNSKGSPKAGVKKQSMSPQMLKRVHLFEKTTPTSTNLQAPASVPLTSTPMSSPLTPDDSGDNYIPKRFPFKPNTITQDVPSKPQNNETKSGDASSNGGALESRTSDTKSGGDARTIDTKTPPTVTFRKRTEAVLKRNSYDNTNRASLDVTNRAPFVDGTNRASLDSSNLLKDISVTQEPIVESRSAVKSQGGPEPTSKDVTVTTQGTPTPQSVTLDHQRSSREMSADSNASDISRNNSLSQDSEAQRKIRAKEKRERRKPTQTVSQETYDQLLKSSGATVLAGKDENEQSLQDSDDSHSNDNCSTKLDEDSSVKVDEDSSVKSGEDSSVKVEDSFVKAGEDSILKEGEDSSVKAVAPAAHMSAYRPSTRPAPRIKPPDVVAPTQSAPFWSSIIEPKSNAPAQPSPLSQPPQSSPPQLSEHLSREDKQDTLDVSNQLDESASSAERSRSKSNARRKHKEKRRVTGIPTEVGENEDIPENVKDIIGKKSVVDVSGSSDQDFNTGDELSCVIGASIVGDDFLRLQKALDEEKAKTTKLQQSHMVAVQEAERLKEKVAELQRRCEDTNRAYEQASGEAARKQSRIDELEKQLQDTQGLKNENQRLRDENCALIRVIGKLSRGPIHA